MSLQSGTTLGPYSVTAQIGAGGMGEVYQARDTKLDRDVALKILPEDFASDPEHLARFQREAKLLASLNHPNIAAIYGLEDSGDTYALVLELVEGPTLQDRISQGAIPLDEALPIAKQIAEALEAAHERGIIHRDLKPANIKVTPDGVVKVLDFGLAKALEPAPASPTADPALSPPLTVAATQMGMVIGTAAYMSPEQARGKPVDRRADIWSFGVVLYEMLTGTRLFGGATVSDTLAAVLRADPDWGCLPGDTPGAVRRLLRRCLERDLRRRLAHVGDARLEIDEPPDAQGESHKVRHAGPVWGVAVAVGLISAAIAATLAWSLAMPSPEPLPVTRFTIHTPLGEPLAASAPIALSHDGKHLAYSVGMQTLNSGSRLYLHSLESFTPRRLEGAQSPTSPFFSPADDSIGFFSEGAGFQQLGLAGGVATPLVDAPVQESEGASWGDGMVVFTDNWGAPLQVLRLDTSETVPLTQLHTDAGERGHLWPQILPGGRTVLFTIWSGASSWDLAQLAVADLATGQHRVIYEGGAHGRYAASGHLVFWRANALMAAPFDVDTLAIGDPVVMVDGVRLDSDDGSAHFALSDTGTLAFVSGGEDAFSESFIIDRSGQELVRLDETQAVLHPAFSPDGGRVALTLNQGGLFQIGVYDLARGVLDRITSVGDNLQPAWSPDGTRLSYHSNADGNYNYYSIDADGSGRPERLLSSGQGYVQSDFGWTPDGQQLVYPALNDATGVDLWVVSPGQGPDPRPLLNTPADEKEVAFSSDGRFLVYESGQSGATDIIVRMFPDVDARQWRVAAGRRPVWSSDGGEILYLTDDGISTVSVDADVGSDSLVLGRPAPLVDMPSIETFDISPDGERLAIHRLPVESAARDIRIVLNWFTELLERVPVP